MAKWVQLVKPYLDDSKLVATDGAGNVLYDWCGWCLAVTQSAFGITKRKYPSAIAAWNDNPDKFAVGGMDIPIGLYVPVFYSGGQYGHVVIAYRESYEKIKIWSSPYKSKPYFDYFEGPVVATLDRVGSIYGCRYLGWTASLTDTKIVSWQADPKPVGPTLTWNKFDEVTKFRTRLQPTHLWGVNCTNFDSVKDIEKFKKGEEVDIMGSVNNKELGNTYLVTPYYYNNGEAVGFNQGDMELVVPEKPEEPVIDNPDVPPAPEDNPEPVEIDEDTYKEVTKEDFEKALEDNVKHAEKVMETIETAGADINFSATTKKVVYILGDLLLLAGAEVSPIITMFNTTDPVLWGTALQQALTIAGVGILVMFKLLKAKSGSKLLK